MSKPIKQNVLLQAIRDHASAKTPEAPNVPAPADRDARVAKRLAEQTPAYLNSCRSDVVLMLAALDRADFDAVIIRGHNLRGSGGGFGLQPITDFGAGIEQSAGEADDSSTRKWVGELSSYLDRVELNSG